MHWQYKHFHSEQIPFNLHFQQLSQLALPMQMLICHTRKHANNAYFQSNWHIDFWHLSFSFCCVFLFILLPRSMISLAFSFLYSFIHIKCLELFYFKNPSFLALCNGFKLICRSNFVVANLLRFHSYAMTHETDAENQYVSEIINTLWNSEFSNFYINFVLVIAYDGPTFIQFCDFDIPYCRLSSTMDLQSFRLSPTQY